ncbi:hypothetical protein EHQ58_01080 [Leptospira ognonensis]|uniref:Uncharacterized protein n=1 Tax=Leptospira ognonensis TaxID=2484945 RepID=A0A4R9K8Y0_9LEPT|nr:hypothetical protein [Leptospira ognonensis]TGL63074.1 hypothetical protein EHQ58_01080 [Leptospira ognonensis]
MNEDIINLNVAIGSISKELLDVQKSLDAYREKQVRQEAVDDAAVVFIEKAELVIEKAERGELMLTDDQKRRIKSNLEKILKKIG